jgi:hypothetical protein
MGLDMYLEAEHYVSDHEENGKELAAAIQRHVGGGLDKFRPKNVTFELAYWRKANAIHNWFVTNVQDGKDECQSSYVPLDALERLKETCEKVLDDIELASELLPTAKGFFFGETGYDEYYVETVEKTLTILNSILSDPNAKRWWITYTASW